MLYLYQFSSMASKLSLARKISEIHQTPANATIVYTILLTTDIGPPQIHATMSKLKIPMLPQLRAPITVRISAILSIIITVTSCFSIVNGFESKPLPIYDLYKSPNFRAVIIVYRLIFVIQVWFCQFWELFFENKLLFCLDKLSPMCYNYLNTMTERSKKIIFKQKVAGRWEAREKPSEIHSWVPLRSFYLKCVGGGGLDRYIMGLLWEFLRLAWWQAGELRWYHAVLALSVLAFCKGFFIAFLEK